MQQKLKPQADITAAHQSAAVAGQGCRHCHELKHTPVAAPMPNVKMRVP